MVQTAKYLQKRIMEELKEAKNYALKASECKNHNKTNDSELYMKVANMKVDIADILNKLAMNKYDELKHEKHKYTTDSTDLEHYYKTLGMYELVYDTYTEFYNSVVIMLNTLKTSNYSK